MTGKHHLGRKCKMKQTLPNGLWKSKSSNKLDIDRDVWLLSHWETPQLTVKPLRGKNSFRKSSTHWEAMAITGSSVPMRWPRHPKENYKVDKMDGVSFRILGGRFCKHGMVFIQTGLIHFCIKNVLKIYVDFVRWRIGSFCIWLFAGFGKVLSSCLGEILAAAATGLTGTTISSYVPQLFQNYRV